MNVANPTAANASSAEQPSSPSTMNVQLQNSVPEVDLVQNTLNPEVEHEEHSPASEARPSKVPRVDAEEFDISLLERDPGLRQQIWDYRPSDQDRVRYAYLKFGPYQPSPPENDTFRKDMNGRSFLPTHLNWLEYSPTKDCAFCLPCFLFAKPNVRKGTNAFTLEGFSSWKKVNDGKNCSFLTHIGKSPNSAHRVAMACCSTLKNKLQHIGAVLEKQMSIQVARNRLRVKTTLDVVRWLTFQGCVFRGRDEGINSGNRGNVIELIKLLASYNNEVAAAVLENGPHNATYSSPRSQKELLRVLADKTQEYIRQEISDGKFCILVDESRDESKKGADGYCAEICR